MYKLAIRMMIVGVGVGGKQVHAQPLLYDVYHVYHVLCPPLPPAAQARDFQQCASRRSIPLLDSYFYADVRNHFCYLFVCFSTQQKEELEQFVENVRNKNLNVSATYGKTLSHWPLFNS